MILIGSSVFVVLVLTGGAAALAAPGKPAPAAAPAAAPAVRATPETCLAGEQAVDPRDCHRLALQLAESREWDRALCIEDTVRARLPQDPEVLAALGRMYQFGKKDVARATEMYHAAMAASPGYPPALFGMGTLMRETGNAEIAARYFARGAKERPDMALFKIRLAEALLDLGRDSEARPLLDEVVQRWPGSPEADAAGRMMGRATALAKP